MCAFAYSALLGTIYNTWHYCRPLAIVYVLGYPSIKLHSRLLLHRYAGNKYSIVMLLMVFCFMLPYNIIDQGPELQCLLKGKQDLS